MSPRPPASARQLSQRGATGTASLEQEQSGIEPINEDHERGSTAHKRENKDDANFEMDRTLHKLHINSCLPTEGRHNEDINFTNWTGGSNFLNRVSLFVKSLSETIRNDFKMESRNSIYLRVASFPGEGWPR